MINGHVNFLMPLSLNLDFYLHDFFVPPLFKCTEISKFSKKKFVEQSLSEYV